MKFILFIFLGGIAALVNILSRYVLSETFNVNFTLAVIIAYCLGLLVNFFANKYVNFKNHGRESYKQLRTFTVVALGGLVMTTGLSILISDALTQTSQHFLTTRAHTIAHITAVGVISIYSFLMHKFFTFREGLRRGISRIIVQVRNV
jgi:putative flippase GtrA